MPGGTDTGAVRRHHRVASANSVQAVIGPNAIIGPLLIVQ